MDVETGGGGGDNDGSVAVTLPTAAAASTARPSLSLYHETLQAFLFSNLIMCVPKLREWGRQGNLKGDPERLQRLELLPCTGADLCTLFQDNQELFTARGCMLHKKNRCALYMQALGIEIDTAQAQTESSNIMFGEHSYHDIVQDLEIVVMSDYRQQSDIVYMVAVSHLLKQVCVIFRGSTTRKDYKQDCKVLLASIPNPIDPDETYNKREEELGIHLGFREYLYAEEPISKVIYKPKVFKKFVALLGSNHPDNDAAAKAAADEIEAQDPRAARLKRGKVSRDLRKSLLLPCKYQIIIEQVLDIIDEHSDYLLFCTGHSLGGALACALAFEAAADPRVPGPVTCVNSGAPKVGSTTYLRAFTYLERKGRIRCAQVSNNRDIIPKFPTNGTLNIFAAACWSDRTFRQMGLQVELCDKARYIVHIPPAHETRVGLLVHDFVSVLPEGIRQTSFTNQVQATLGKMSRGSHATDD